MKNKAVPFLFLLIFVGVSLSGQSGKTIREKKIVSKTVDEYFIEEGYDKPMVESYKEYNEEGDIVELKELNKGGKVTKWEKYVYDKDGEMVEEIFLDEKGKVTITEKNIYEDGLRVEKRYFNAKGKLYKKKVYRYEYRQ
jgi:hypothetical protein